MANGLNRLLNCACLATAEAAAALLISLALTAPASAQFFFDDRWFERQRRPQPQAFPPFQAPRVERPPPPPPADFSKAPAPPPRRADTRTNIVVMGDSIADWLAYGLEDAFADTPEVGIVRKHKAFSGLIRYETRRDTPEWMQVAREIIAADKPHFIVMLVGLADRDSIRERARPAPAQPSQQAGRPGQQPGQPQPAQPGQPAQPAQPAQPGQTAPPAAPQRGEQPGQPAPQDAAQPADTRGGATHEFRSEKWAEVYGQRVDETIAVLKSAGVPVLWVGIPSIRGTRSTSDVTYLNNLFRARAEKAGITFVDVWDGFVDETGRFVLRGPDVEGQTRPLRTTDGVHFTKHGARKLAHYVEREIRRNLGRVVPVALPVPAEPTAPQAPVAAPAARPSGPAPRPAVGPVVPLATTVGAADELLGGGGARPAGSDPLATRVLVKGEPVAPPTGRADDFTWPRRGPTPGGAGPPTPPVVANTAPDAQPSSPQRQGAAGAETQRPRTQAQQRPPRPRAPVQRQESARPPSDMFPFFRPTR